MARESEENDLVLHRSGDRVGSRAGVDRDNQMIEMFWDSEIKDHQDILSASFNYKPPMNIFWDDALLEALKDIENVIDNGMKEIKEHGEFSEERLVAFRDLIIKDAKDTNHWTLHRDFGCDQFIWVTYWIEEDR